MRVLALDYGRARCGCAVSDPTGVLASPIEPIRAPQSRRGLARLRTLVRDFGEDPKRLRAALDVTERLCRPLSPHSISPLHVQIARSNDSETSDASHSPRVAPTSPGYDA